MTFVFHDCGSQLLNFEMPGSKRVLTDSFIERRMHDYDLTEDQLFGYREDELPHIQAGTVMLIPEVEKERILDLICFKRRCGFASNSVHWYQGSEVIHTYVQ